MVTADKDFKKVWAIGKMGNDEAKARPQSKRLETLSTFEVLPIASPIKGAIETTLILLETRTASVA